MQASRAAEHDVFVLVFVAVLVLVCVWRPHGPRASLILTRTPYCHAPSPDLPAPGPAALAGAHIRPAGCAELPDTGGVGRPHGHVPLLGAERKDGPRDRYGGPGACDDDEGPPRCLEREGGPARARDLQLRLRGGWGAGHRSAQPRRQGLAA